MSSDRTPTWSARYDPATGQIVGVGTEARRFVEQRIARGEPVVSCQKGTCMHADVVDLRTRKVRARTAGERAAYEGQRAPPPPPENDLEEFMDAIVAREKGNPEKLSAWVEKREKRRKQ